MTPDRKLQRLLDTLVIARRRVNRQKALNRKVVPITPGSPWRNLHTAARNLKAYMASGPHRPPPAR